MFHGEHGSHVAYEVEWGSVFLVLNFAQELLYSPFHSNTISICIVNIVLKNLRFMSAILLNMNLEKLRTFNRSSSWRLHSKMKGNSPAWNCCQTGHIILSLGPCHSQNTTNNWFWAFCKHSRFIIHKVRNEDGTSKQPTRVQVISMTSVQ